MRSKGAHLIGDGGRVAGAGRLTTTAAPSPHRPPGAAHLTAAVSLMVLAGADVLTEAIAPPYVPSRDELYEAPPVARRGLPERRRLDDGGRRRPPTVSLVIPALNEERNLPNVLSQLPPDVHEVVLVDGRSTDRTLEVVREMVPDVVVVAQPGFGKGDALRAGFEAASGDAIVMLDADGSMNPREIPRFVDALQGGAEFVKGSRFLSGGGSADITWLRKAGNLGLRTIFNGLYGAEHTDLCYGFAAFWRRCLPELSFTNDGFEVETVLCIRSAQADLRVCEVPSFELRREHGQSNLRVIRDGWRIVNVLLRERRHLRGHAPGLLFEEEPSVAY